MKTQPKQAPEAAAADPKSIRRSGPVGAFSRQILSRELGRRLERNPRYSLRAFSKALGVSHSLLSRVLAGKRTVTPELAETLANRLALSPQDTKRLMQEAILRKIPSLDEVAGAQDEAGETLTLDQFTLIAEWEHYAILSYLNLPRAKWDAKSIARELKIPEARAKLSMERLERLGMVGLIDGRMKQTSKPIRVENKISTPATRTFHKRLLERAVESLENDPQPLRDFSSITFAVDPDLVPHALERIRAFRRELASELESMSAPKSVYNLTVQFFPVTQTNSNPNSNQGEET